MQALEPGEDERTVALRSSWQAATSTAATATPATASAAAFLRES